MTKLFDIKKNVICRFFCNNKGTIRNFRIFINEIRMSTYKLQNIAFIQKTPMVAYLIGDTFYIFLERNIPLTGHLLITFTKFKKYKTFGFYKISLYF